MKRNSILNPNTIAMKVLAIFMMVTSMACSTSGKDEVATTQNEGWFVTIKGKVEAPQNGNISIMEMKEGAYSWTDTINLKKDNTFTKKVKISEPGYYRINFFGKQNVDVILFKSDIEVLVGANGSDVKGSPELEVIRKTQNMLQAFDQSPEVSRLNDEFTKAGEVNDQRKMGELQSQYLTLQKEAHAKIAAYLREQPASLGVINLLDNNILDKDQFFDTYVAVADKVRKEWPTYAQGQKFVTSIDKLKMLAIGQPAPEISLPNPEGQVVKLSSLRGKYVLVDFWAKWCGPCRKENPNVVRAFNQYKDKGFTVFGVSLDRSKEDWVQAIQQDGLTWTHVSDLKYWQSDAAKLYNVNSIPFSLLLDKNGIIIAKNLRGPALEAKLHEVLDTPAK